MFSSPEPLGSQGKLIVHPSPFSIDVVVHNVQTSPLKPLDQSKPNFVFMWNILRKGGTKVCINGPGHMTKMTSMYI